MSIVLSVSRCVFWFFSVDFLGVSGGAVPGPDSHSCKAAAPGLWVVWLQTSVMCSKRQSKDGLAFSQGS